MTTVYGSRMPLPVMRRLSILIALLACAGVAHAQTSTINWTNIHQVIDGFGAANWGQPALTVRTANILFQHVGIFHLPRRCVQCRNLYFWELWQR